MSDLLYDHTKKKLERARRIVKRVKDDVLLAFSEEEGRLADAEEDGKDEDVRNGIDDSIEALGRAERYLSFFLQDIDFVLQEGGDQ